MNNIQCLFIYNHTFSDSVNMLAVVYSTEYFSILMVFILICLESLIKMKHTWGNRPILPELLHTEATTRHITFNDRSRGLV